MLAVVVMVAAVAAVATVAVAATRTPEAGAGRWEVLK